MIKIENLTKRFGDATIFSGLDLTISKGEIVVVIGPSGTGKSTLLRCINFLETADEGHLTLGDVSVESSRLDKKKSWHSAGKPALCFRTMPYLPT